MFFTKAHEYFLSGVHEASALSLLVFGGKSSVKSSNSIVVGDFFEVPFEGELKEPLLHLRETFATLIGAFAQGSEKHGVDALALRHLLCYNIYSVKCVPFQRMVSMGRAASSRARVQQPPPQPQPDRADSGDKTEHHMASRARCDQELPPVSTCPPCKKGGTHNATRARRGRPEYEFFQAATDGCLACVRKELEDSRSVAPDILSDSQKWSVRDCAKFSMQKDVPGASEVCAYLESYWAHVPLST
jgi:hypothetical protein